MPMPHRLPVSPRRSKRPTKFFDPEAFLANSGIGRSILHFSPKQVVFSQGQRADAVFYIQQGRVRLSVLSKQGKEATIALFGPGDFLGEGCLASDQSLRMAAAVAITDCTVLRIERSQYPKHPPRRT